MLENPELLIGIPLAIIGIIGILLVIEAAIVPTDGARDSTGGSAAGWQAFVAIAWLTIVEYIIAVWSDYNIPALFAIAIVKVVLICIVFMHIKRLRNPEEH